MKRKLPITLLSAAIFWGTLAVAESDKPNIIVILADDMGYGDCTAYNPESKVVTPSIDQLAGEGLLFTDAHSASTTCTASRYGLLTGITPARRGVVNGICRLGPVLEAKELTVAELLKGQGYTTRMVGKWHLGFELKPSNGIRPIYDFTKPFTGGPIDHGFDSFLGLRQAVSAGPYFYIRNRQPEAVPSEVTEGTKSSERDRRTTYSAGDMAPGFVHEASNSRLCDEVVKIIRDQAEAGEKSQPLFLYYAMLEPHTPWLPEDRFAGKSEAGPYGDYIVQLDHELGRVLEVLKETGLAEDTLLFFSSDNGALWPEQDIQKWGHRANGPLAGGKARPQEGGHRVPFIARWPGQIPAAAKTDATINHTDFLATFADLLDIDLAEAGSEFPTKDSHSFLSVLKNPGNGHQRPAMAVTTGSFRKGDWKLTFTRGPRGNGPEGRQAANAELFNLVEDIGEMNDLSASEPERKQRLFAAYQAYFADLSIKPLAKQLREGKSRKKTDRKPSGKKPPPSSEPKPGAPILTDTSTVTRESLITEYKKKRTEFLKKQADLLTEEQKVSSEIARKQALAEGKKGVPLRNAIDAGANLSAEQKSRLDGLRKQMGQLTRDHREQLKNLTNAEN